MRARTRCRRPSGGGGPHRRSSGAAPAKVTVIGGGVVGTEVARVAVGMGADVTILERSTDRIWQLGEQFGPDVRLLMSDETTLVEALAESDVVVGAVLVPGARTPCLISREMLGLMKARAVVVDAAIDQGGCCETSRPPIHDDPVYEVDGVLHYCVSNMPGAVPVTSTRALTNATMPYARRLASARATRRGAGGDARLRPRAERPRRTGCVIAGRRDVRCGCMSSYQRDERTDLAR